MDKKILKVLQYPNDILRAPTHDVDHFGPLLEEIAKSMFDTMLYEGGIGLAGPQVSILFNIIAINTRHIEPETGFTGIMVNPKIIYKSPTIADFDERCLSFKDVYVKVNAKRSKIIVVEYRNIYGEKFAEKYDGLTAICLQHEIDHLNGKLLIDYVEPGELNESK